MFLIYRLQISKFHTEDIPKELNQRCVKQVLEVYKLKKYGLLNDINVLEYRQG